MLPDIGKAFSEFVKTGAEAPFAQLSEAGRPVILSWLTSRRICKANDAEDAYQEALLDMWQRYSSECITRRQGKFPPSRIQLPFSSHQTLYYIFSIAKRKALHGSVQGRATMGSICLVGNLWDLDAAVLAGTSIANVSCKPASSPTIIEMYDLINASLPKDEAQVLNDVFWDDYEIREIARRRGHRVAVVCEQFLRAKCRVRELLAGYPNREASGIGMSWLANVTSVLSTLENVGVISRGLSGNFAAALFRRIIQNARGEISMGDLDHIARQQNVPLDEAHFCVEYIRSQLPNFLNRYFLSAGDGTTVSPHVVWRSLSMGVDSIEWQDWAADVRVVWRINHKGFWWDVE